MKREVSGKPPSRFGMMLYAGIRPLKEDRLTREQGNSDNHGMLTLRKRKFAGLPSCELRALRI